MQLNLKELICLINKKPLKVEKWPIAFYNNWLNYRLFTEKKKKYNGFFEGRCSTSPEIRKNADKNTLVAFFFSYMIKGNPSLTIHLGGEVVGKWTLASFACGKAGWYKLVKEESASSEQKCIWIYPLTKQPNFSESVTKISRQKWKSSYLHKAVHYVTLFRLFVRQVVFLKMLSAHREIKWTNNHNGIIKNEDFSQEKGR